MQIWFDVMTHHFPNPLHCNGEKPITEILAQSSYKNLAKQNF